MEKAGVNANSLLYPLRANLAHYRNDSPFENNIIVGKPFCALPRYAIKGLTSSVALSRLWHEQAKVNIDIFNNVRLAFLHKTQLNGCFYKDMELTSQEIVQKITSVTTVDL